MAEITCLGAAMAAGHAVGTWPLQKNVDDEKSTKCEQFPETEHGPKSSEKIFRPVMKEEARADKYKTWKKAVKMSFGWL